MRGESSADHILPPDRPDVMARFTTTITADVSAVPIMLSNGNPGAIKVAATAAIASPGPIRVQSPSYLFALVAGDRSHEGPVHDAFRSPCGAWHLGAPQGSKSLARWEPEIVRPVVNGLIDEFIDAGEADLVKDFTLEFPTRVIAKLLGLPEEDLPWFRKLRVELISYTVKYKRAFEASAALKDYFLEQIELRRSKPTEDIIGDLVTAEIDGEKLSDEAIYSFLRLLLPAGLETTYRSSGNLLYLLLTHREQFAGGAGRSRAHRPAIEEGLRFETPLTTVQRYATEDTELEGVALPEGCGDRRLHRLGQPRRNAMGERSEEFDIFRKRLPHISFAAGEHTCMGLHLARMETRVALECLLDRLTDIQLDHRRRPAHPRPAVPLADRAAGDVHPPVISV